MTDVNTAETNVRFRSLGRSGTAGLTITLAIHGVLALLVYQSQVRSAPRPEAVRDVIITRMIKFNKPREKPWLPRIVAPPVVKPPDPVIKLAEDPLAPPAPPTPPREAPKPEDPKLSKDMKRALERARALSRAVSEEPEDGPVGGTAEGTSSEQVQGDEYATAIFNAIQRNWNAPSGLLNDAQLAGLSAEVRVHIDGDGTLKNVSLTKSSGNDLFDDSALQAVRATARVPPPPPAERAKYRRGTLLDFAGKDLAR
jgi:TonB family protein